jgi:hypothetical protein
MYLFSLMREELYDYSHDSGLLFRSIMEKPREGNTGIFMKEVLTSILQGIFI